MASSYSAYKCGSREGGHVSLARRMYSQACSYLASDYVICYLFKKLKRALSSHLLNLKHEKIEPTF